MSGTVAILLLVNQFAAPHAPGCLQGDAALLQGRDKGAATLTLIHELGVSSAPHFRAGRAARGSSYLVSGVQRVYGVSHHCALCLASYVQCGAKNDTCSEACADFKSPNCRTCVATVCGNQLLHCTRASFDLSASAEV